MRLGPTFRETAPVAVASIAATSIGSIPLWFVPIVIGVYIDVFGLSFVEAGLLAAVELLALGLCAVSAAPFAHRFSLRSLALAAGATGAAANAGTAFLEPGVTFVLLRVIAGISVGFCYLAMTATLAATRETQTLYGAVIAAASILCALALLILPIARPWFGPGYIFAVQAAIYLGLLPFMVGFSRNPTSSAAVAQLMPRFRSLDANILLIGHFLLWLSVGAFWSVAERLGLSRGIAIDTIILSFALSSAASVAGAAGAAWLATRVSGIGPLVGGIAGYVACVIVCAWTSEPLIFLAAIVLFNAILMFTLPIALGVAAMLDRMGRVAAGIGGTMMIGQGFGPLFGLWALTAGALTLTLLSILIAFMAMVLMVWVLLRAGSSAAIVEESEQAGA